MTIRMSIKTHNILQPEWPAPASVSAISTQRCSLLDNTEETPSIYAGLNLALHVGDAPERVKQNRRRLRQQCQLPSEPLWLDQVHGIEVINATETTGNTTPEADGSISLIPNKVCVVMTADCLPLLICNRQGNKVAAAHAGWKGLANGVIEATIERLDEAPENLLVWLGPAIGPVAFEVGEEVRQQFIQQQASADAAFKPVRAGHYLADIYTLARLRLQAMGVSAIYGGTECTFTDADHYYSYRRDGKTGRQASLIWLSE